ncbi:hypothetical protein, variant [Saprolegnia diclina VS20]|uniref:DNA mismatch repair proteins mutS family domain-containing protein n=1 Tax=Saprolegnia diclina (strain VS20) TaxID=1156394 RepID=T0R1G6_SAPDV|nr:hypothetical protein, variant [Saprolegnia diclina VS20]EQC40806.1 hypothetical protein, variant [Saprolegnia diclina VS20]|eukprot:XP_008605650.1 hypothetical protein, variant [Saprolegnia diclina VS20]
MNSTRKTTRARKTETSKGTKRKKGPSHPADDDASGSSDDDVDPNNELEHETQGENGLDEEPREVFMALFIEKGKLGVAVYDAMSTKLKTAQIPITNSDLSLTLEMLKTQMEPRAIVVSHRNFAKFDIDFLKSDEYTEVCHRKPSDFGYAKACKSIANLRIGTDWEHYGRDLSETTEREVFKYLGSFFDFDSLEMIRAVGALLIFLSAENIVNQLETTTTISILAVEKASLDGVMLIDAIALKSLQIFNEEYHPSQLRAWEKSKEGFSIFSLLDHTMTKCGKAMLRQWMLKPLTDIDAIEARQDAIQFFLASSRNDLVNSLLVKLKAFKDVARSLLHMKQMRSSVQDWTVFYQSLNNFLGMRKEVTKLPRDILDSIRLLERIASLESLEQVSNMLGNVIDFEASKDEAYCVIREGISEELDQAREKFGEIDNVLLDMSNVLANAYPEMRGIAVQYIPRIGYAICCPQSCQVPRSFEFQFEDGLQRFYKDVRCCKLDESYGDIHGQILDLQQGLLLELYDELMEHEVTFYDMIDVASELDCFLSLARAAREFNFTRPVMCEDITFVAKTARHPLQELTVESYIPNDVSLDTATGLIHVLTGENGSGKSVYLKMVGVLQYMAQLGSFIPVSEARIGIVTKLFTRIQSFETVLLSHSSFTIDCNQIATMLRHCDERSLLLIDEFGKGTSAIDGVCLLAAVLKDLKDTVLRHGGPKILMTTHFLEIFQEPYLRDHLEFREVHQIECKDQARIIEETSTIACFVMSSVPINVASKGNVPTAALFEVVPGIATSSNAFRCATVAGVNERVLTRAHDILDCRRSKTPIAPLADTNNRDEAFEVLTMLFVNESNWLNASSSSLHALLDQARSISLD